jgi:hypothetical protein
VRDVLLLFNGFMKNFQFFDPAVRWVQGTPSGLNPRVQNRES